jgi:hypothetical protein
LLAGTLELVSATVPDSTAYVIGDGNSGVLLLDTAPSAGDTFLFGDVNAGLALANDTGINDDTIEGLTVGVDGAKTDFVDIEGHTVKIDSFSGTSINLSAAPSSS